MALTKDRNTKVQGQYRSSAPKAAAVKIFQGAMVSYNVAGFLKPSDNTVSEVFAGIADETVDNSGGAAGDKRCRLKRGAPFLMAEGALVQADVGNKVYCTADNVIANAGNVEVGTLLDFDETTGQAIVEPKHF